jgi:hypothetical protein
MQATRFCSARCEAAIASQYNLADVRQWFDILGIHLRWWSGPPPIAGAEDVDFATLDRKRVAAGGWMREALDEADYVRRVALIVQALKTFSHPDGVDQEATDLNRAIEDTLVVARTEYRNVSRR